MITTKESDPYLRSFDPSAKRRFILDTSLSSLYIAQRKLKMQNQDTRPQYTAPAIEESMKPTPEDKQISASKVVPDQLTASEMLEQVRKQVEEARND